MGLDKHLCVPVFAGVRVYAKKEGEYANQPSNRPFDLADYKKMD